MAEEKIETAEETEELEEAPEEKPKKGKKAPVKRRKTKKEKESPAVKEIRLVVETGKVSFGSRQGLKSVLTGKPKAVVVPSKAPADIYEDVKNYSEHSGVPLIEFEGSTMELGSVCGKPFPVSVLCIYDEGTSNILKLAK